MPAAHADERCIPEIRKDRMFREAVAHVAEPDATAATLDLERQDPVDEDVARQQRRKRVAERALAAEARPRDAAPLRVGGVLAAMAADVLRAVVDAQGDAGEDVRGEREAKEERLERERLIVGARQEEVGF